MAIQTELLTELLTDQLTHGVIHSHQVTRRDHKSPARWDSVRVGRNPWCLNLTPIAFGRPGRTLTSDRWATPCRTEARLGEDHLDGFGVDCWGSDLNQRTSCRRVIMCTSVGVWALIIEESSTPATPPGSPN